MTQLTDEQLANIAHDYYLSKLNIADISQKYSLSRYLITKALDDAQDKGIVKINIYQNTKRDEKLERKFLQLFDHPITSTKNNDLDNLIMKTTSKYFDNKFVQIGLSGITDATRYLKNKPDNFPMAIFGPGQTDLAHVSNEYIYKDFYLKFADIYRDIMKAYLK